MAAAAKTQDVQAVTIPPIDVRRMTLKLVGDSELICHKWSEKAKKEMLDKQMGKAKSGKKAPKDPEQDYRDSLYEIAPGVYGFPSVGFKSAAVSACRYVDGMKMTEARGAFHVVGEFVTINGTPRMREDMVRVGMGTADIRYRGGFVEWSAEVTIAYNAGVFQPEQIVNLFNQGGFGVGVGEWRPEKDGAFGRFHVARGDE